MSRKSQYIPPKTPPDAKVQWLRDNRETWRYLSVLTIEEYSPTHHIHSIGFMMKKAGLYSDSYMPNFWAILRMMQSIVKDEASETLTSLGD